MGMAPITEEDKPAVESMIKRIGRLRKRQVASDRLAATIKEIKFSGKPRCRTCKHFDVLKDPAHPEINNLCTSYEVLALGVQPEPNEGFGCIFHET